MATKAPFEPAESFHPSCFIEEELAERGWTVRDLVFRMRRYESEKDWAVNCLAVELYMTVQTVDLLLDDQMAEGFALAFGTSKELFLNLDKQWREKARRDRQPRVTGPKI
jgi:plasmid maintenance system antidote protein VapI